MEKKKIPVNFITTCSQLQPISIDRMINLIFFSFKVILMALICLNLLFLQNKNKKVYLEKE